MQGGIAMLSWIIEAIRLLGRKTSLLIGLSFHMSYRRRGKESYGADLTVSTELGSHDESQTSPSAVNHSGEVLE